MLLYQIFFIVPLLVNLVVILFQNVHSFVYHMRNVLHIISVCKYYLLVFQFLYFTYLLIYYFFILRIHLGLLMNIIIITNYLVTSNNLYFFSCIHLNGSLWKNLFFLTYLVILLIVLVAVKFLVSHLIRWIRYFFEPKHIIWMRNALFHYHVSLVGRVKCCVINV